jgi:hypothetical protein
MTQDQNEENKAIQDDEPDQFETPTRGKNRMRIVTTRQKAKNGNKPQLFMIGLSIMLSYGSQPH